MTDQKLRVGIIGIGLYAGEFLLPRLLETGRAEVVAIARRNPDRLAAAQKALNVPNGYTDWRELLNKSALDAVIVTTPPDSHADPTLAALQRGLHVFLEKPVAVTSADAQRIVDAAAKTDRTVMVGYNSRGLANWRMVKRLLDEGRIGTLRQINATLCVDARYMWQELKVAEPLQALFDSSVYYGDVFAPGNWRTQPEVVGGGMFADIGSHTQDLMLWYGNGSPSRVVGFAQSVNSPSIVSAMATLDNGVMLSFTFNDAVSGGDEVTFYTRGSMTLYGDRGRIVVDWGTVDGEETVWLDREGVTTKVEPQVETIHPMTAFVATVLDGASNMCPVDGAAKVVALTEAVYQSAAGGQVVQMP